MPRYSTIATALDKHKIASATAYLVMLEVSVKDSANDLIEIVRVACNNETYEWQNNSYYPCYFEADVVYEQDKLPSVTITVRDFQSILQQRMQAYNGLTGCNVRMLVVNTSVANNPPELDENFTVISAKADASNYSITFTLGCENPLGLRFPPYLAFRDRCRFLYKGTECGYTGTLPSCDLTFLGTNGCKVHDNTVRFGGFPGIKVSGY